MLVATFCGVMSACFSYGLAAGDPIRTATLRHGTAPLWQGLPVLVAVLLGGFLTNLAWCLPKLPNYLVCALAGGIWYFQFFFYTMGETQMGAYKFSSWTLHMASIIIFSSLWGIALHEWRGAGRRTKGLLALSLAFLLASTMIVGYGNYLGTVPSERGSAHVALYFGPLADGSVKKSTGVTLPGGRGSVTHCKYRSIFLNRAC